MKLLKTITKKSISAILAVTLLLVSYSAAFAQVGNAPQDWENVEGCTIDGVATIQGLQCLLGNVLTVAITVIGLAAFVMLIFGAFGYMLSGGNSKGTENARNTITFAIVGIVVALSAFIILNLIANFTGLNGEGGSLNITRFVIPESGDGNNVIGR